MTCPLAARARPNPAYFILYAANLPAASWSKLADSPAASTNRLAEFLDPQPDQTQRYYRVLAPSAP